MENPSFEVLTSEACTTHLRDGSVGRIAFVLDGKPVVFPINYRLIGDDDVELVLRTRPGNVIDHAPAEVAFEIDEVDAVRRTGWSVLVQGTLRQVSTQHVSGLEQFDPDTWLADRDAWLSIVPSTITGRRIVAADTGWPIDPRSYL